MTIEDAAILLIGALSIITAVAVVVLGVEMGRLLIRLDPARSDLALVPGEGLAAGDRLPTLEVRQFPTGTPVNVAESTLLIFVANSCEPCRALWPGVIRMATRRTDLKVVAVVADDPLGFRGDADGEGPNNLAIVFDNTGEMAGAYGVRRTPFAYVVWGGLIRAKGVVNRYEHLVTLLEGHGLPAPPAWNEVAEVQQ